METKIGADSGGPAKALPARGLVTRRLSEVRPEPIRWLVPDFIPQAALTIIAGEGGLGVDLDHPPGGGCESLGSRRSGSATPPRGSGTCCW